MKLVPLRESKRIFENGLGQVESNPVLCEILPVLPLVVLNLIPAAIQWQISCGQYKCQYKGLREMLFRRNPLLLALGRGRKAGHSLAAAPEEKIMRRASIMAALCLALAAPAALIAQDSGGQAAAAPSTYAPADSLNALMGMLQWEVVGAAEAMPADKYDFAPTSGEFKGVRSFGAQVKHLAEANYEFFHGWDVPGATAVDSKTIEALKSKDEIVKALKDSYTYAHAAVGTITPQNAWDSVKGFPPQFKETKATAAAFAIAHSMDHYGQMVEYLRMNGIIPPASRPQPKGSM